MEELKRRGRMSIDDRIAIAERKAMTAKEKYEQALAYVDKLKHEKSLASVDAELKQAMKDSARSPEEILEFLRGSGSTQAGN